MLVDRAAVSVFAAFLLLACSDSNLGTPGNLTIDGSGTTTDDAGTGTNSYLASGQCPPVGSTICPNDQPATQDDFDQCNGSLGETTCGGLYKTYLECAGKNVKCDSTGQSDSTAIQAACGDEANAYESCAFPTDAG